MHKLYRSEFSQYRCENKECFSMHTQHSVPVPAAASTVPVLFLACRFVRVYRSEPETVSDAHLQVKSELLNVPDRPMSMFEGLAGAICFWADLLGPELSHFPGFDLPTIPTQSQSRA